MRIYPSFIAAALLSLEYTTAFAEKRLQYAFKEGEPLPYAMQIAVKTAAARDSRFYNNIGSFSDTNNVDIKFTYQLMPIVLNTNGTWKLRIVVDEASQEITKKGERKKTTLNREQLRAHQF